MIQSNIKNTYNTMWKPLEMFFSRCKSQWLAHQKAFFHCQSDSIDARSCNIVQKRTMVTFPTIKKDCDNLTSSKLFLCNAYCRIIDLEHHSYSSKGKNVAFLQTFGRLVCKKVLSASVLRFR